jgi:hypothetical protein
MPDAKDCDRTAAQSVPHFVVANDQPADLPRFKPANPLAKARILDEPVHGAEKFEKNSSRCMFRFWSEKVVKAIKIRDCFIVPLQSHFLIV